MRGGEPPFQAVALIGAGWGTDEKRSVLQGRGRAAALGGAERRPQGRDGSHETSSCCALPAWPPACSCRRPARQELIAQTQAPPADARLGRVRLRSRTPLTQETCGYPEVTGRRPTGAAAAPHLSGAPSRRQARRLVVKAGSVLEEEGTSADWRTSVEHISFEGTRPVPGVIQVLLSRLGIGPDANAATQL